MRNPMIKKIMLVFFVLTISIPVVAQSDYEMVQSYKDKHLEITRGIEAALNVEDLYMLIDAVEKLRRDFEDRKEILDASLYPDNFNSSLKKLSEAIELRRKDVTEITGLQTEVVELKTEVGTLKFEIDSLSRRNNSIINQISVLETQRKKDVATIARLDKLVETLRASIQERDQLIYGIVDSLIPKLQGDLTALSRHDKDEVYSEVEKTNVIDVVKKSLKDNSRLLELASLNANDLDEVKEQKEEFVEVWQKIGPKLVDVYQDKKNKTAELNEIDFLFNEWERFIKQEAWESIREEFAVYTINLKRFTNGQEFTDVVTDFIEEEIKNYNVKDKNESELIYEQFTDSVWFSTVQPDWIRYLMDNNMLNVEQKNFMEGKIAKWKAIVAPTNLAWVYIIIGVVLINGIVFFVIKSRKKKKTPPNTTTTIGDPE